MSEKKVCLKCGEVYMKSELSYWQIFRNSGIPYVKKDYSIMINDHGLFTFPPGQIKLNSRMVTCYVNHYDENAMEELENDRCIMEDCDGILKLYNGEKYEFLSLDKKREYFPKYFGEEECDI